MITEPNKCIFEEWEKRYGGIKNRQLYLDRECEIESSAISKTINVIKQNQTQLQSINKVRNGIEGATTNIKNAKNETQNNEEFDYDWDREESLTLLKKITGDISTNV